MATPAMIWPPLKSSDRSVEAPPFVAVTTINASQKLTWLASSISEARKTSADSIVSVCQRL